VNRISLRVAALVGFVMLAPAGALAGSGDLNGDGKVDKADLLAMRALCSKAPATHFVSCGLADLDGDGLVASSDFLGVLRPANKNLSEESETWQLMKSCMQKKSSARVSCGVCDFDGDGQVRASDFATMKEKMKK